MIDSEFSIDADMPTSTDLSPLLKSPLPQGSFADSFPAGPTSKPQTFECSYFYEIHLFTQ